MVRRIFWYCQLACGAVLFLEIMKIDKIPFPSASACGSLGSLSAVIRRPEGPSQLPGGSGRPPSCPGAAGARGVAWPPLGYAQAVRVAGTCRHGRGSAWQYSRPNGDAPSMRAGHCGPGLVLQQHRPTGAQAGSRSMRRNHAPQMVLAPAPYAAVAFPGPRQVPIGSSMPVI